MGSVHILTRKPDTTTKNEWVRHLQFVYPTNITGKREYLTPTEVWALLDAALERKARYAHRDYTRSVAHVPHGLRVGIQYKDTQTYFGINIDGNTSKTICRLWLNSENKSIVIFDVNNKEVKTKIRSLDEIYGIAKLLKDRAMFLAKNNTEAKVTEK